MYVCTQTTNEETWGSVSSYTTVTLHDVYVNFIRWRLKERFGLSGGSQFRKCLSSCGEF